MTERKVLKKDDYLLQEVITYHANPFIEALPAIIDKPEFFKRMTCLPLYDEKLRQAPDHLRAHGISDGFDFFLALPRHQTLHTCIERMLRRGYLARNPIPPELYWQLMQERLRTLSADLEPLQTLNQRTFRRVVAGASDLTTALTGVSGGGKTLALKMDLAHIPQVNEHGKYHDFGLNIRQVSWLWIETSHKGSPNDLCLSFFRALDELLGTPYEHTYGKGNLGTMMSQVARLAALHAIGLLIVDEIQELSNVKSGGDKALLGFFLRLTNTIKIPVLMVGTYKAEAMLREQMRVLRRSTGIGLRSWEPLSRTLPEWDAFLKVLWRYQYTKTPTELKPELSDALFDECQGIPDFAVKLCFLCQDRLIATNDGKGKEKITPRVIKTVATEYLSPARDLLQALRYKDKEKLELLDDVKLPTLAELVEQRRAAIEIVIGFGPQTHAAQVDANETSRKKPIEDSNTIDEAQDPPPEIDCTATVEKRKPKLTACVGANADDPEAAYKALAAAGYIKSAGEFATETIA
jgi:AAA domain